MKKTLSIIMSLCMILSVCFISVSAAEATIGSVAADYKPAEGAIAVTNEAEFLAMAADGNYYLANDITIAATWNAGAAVSSTYKENAAFTGTFDGNGKVVTTSAPLFANLQGTVKNLTVEGAIDAGGIHGANITLWTNGTLTVDNVYTKADVTNGVTCGGVIGYGATGTNATITNCRNDANISCTSQIGGIVGYIQDDVAVISDCVNYGNLETTSYGAGIIGRFGRDKALPPDSNITITNCVNYGTVKGAKGQTSGILGYLVGDATIADCTNYGEIINETVCAAGILGSCYDDVKESCAILMTNCANYGTLKGATILGGIAGRFGYSAAWSAKAYTMINCANYADIYATAPANYEKTIYAGGLIGYAYGGSADVPNSVEGCINTGNVIVDCSTSTGSTYVAGMIAYVNAANYKAINNVSTGNITVTGTPTTVTLSIYNKNLDNTNTTNNYALAIDGIAASLAGDAGAETLAEAAFATAVTADQLASGEVAYLINEAAGATVYYQAIGTDKVPTLAAAEDGSNTVLKKDDGSYGNPVTDPVDPAPTGDSALAFAVVALISLLGIAVVAKKREN